MLLSISDLVDTLRTEVSITNSQAGLEDKGLLDLTDEQLVTMIKIGASKLYPEMTDFNDISDEEGAEYPLMLLAKVELFIMLATLKADLVDMNADNANRLNLSQRFAHYKDLADAAQKAFDKWSDDAEAGGGTGGVVTSYNVILDTRHFTERNYNEQKLPQVTLKIRNVTADSAEVSWSVKYMSHFGAFKVYLGTSPCIDMYRNGAYLNDKVTENAKCIRSTLNFRDNSVRLQNLDAETTYYVAVASIEQNQLFGYKEKAFTTLKPFNEEESSDPIYTGG